MTPPNLRRFVVKVQRAIRPPDEPDCLVYDEDHEHISKQVIPDSAMKAMKERSGIFSMKAYFEAEWDEFAEGWLIGKIVKDEPW
jgi:hypothetical protein